MKYITLIFVALLLNVSANAQKINCDNIDNTKVYQALCTYGSKTDVDCQGYSMVEGLGDIPATGPFISNKPYFIKTPDMNINEIVNCNYFKAFVSKSNYPVENISYHRYNSSEQKTLVPNKKI